MIHSWLLNQTALEGYALVPPLRIGMLGLGNVGAGVVRLLEQNRRLIEQKAGVGLHLTRALVRTPGKVRDLGGAAPELVTDPEAIVAAPDIDLVVEVLGGTDPARDYIVKALRAGKPVVTANKDVMAEYGADVFAAAEAGGVDVYFEASVGGGIPIIRPLKDSLGANRIRSIMGIVNGTTNYILTRMTLEGREFAAALKEAQDLGYAEPDPTADVEGLDAGRKLAILASLGFLSRVTPRDVYTEGISGISARDIEHGRRLGWVVKLLAIGKEVDGGVEVRVHPTFIPSTHPLASVNGSLNAIFVTGDAVGETMFLGRGAGAFPTASSILGDVIAAARAKRHGQSPLGCSCYTEKPIRPMAAVETRYYLRLTVKDQPGVLARIAGALGGAGVSIAHILQTPDEAAGTAEIAVVTHKVAERQVRGALAGLKGLPDVLAVECLIRIEA